MAILIAMSRHSIAETRNNLSKLIDRALAGDEVEITRRGEVVVRLVPEQPSAKRVDVEWLRANQVKLEGGPVDSTTLIRQLRDEGY